MVTSHYLIPLIINLSGKGRSSELAAHVSLQMEVWVGFEAFLRFTSLTDSGEYFQPRLHADIWYLPIAQAQHQTEFEPSPQAHGCVRPLAPKGGRDDFRPGGGLKIKPCPAVLCLLPALPVICCVILSNHYG